MKKVFYLIQSIVLFASCSVSNNGFEENQQIGNLIINSSDKFVKVLDFKPVLLKSACSDNKKEINIQKSNYLRGYCRSFKFVKENPDGTLIFNATKDSLKVTAELFNMVKYVLDDYNGKIEKIKKEYGEGSYTVSSIKNIYVKSLDDVSLEELNSLYFKANKIAK
jgi:hypothetical protein